MHNFTATMRVDGFYVNMIVKNFMIYERQESDFVINVRAIFTDNTRFLCAIIYKYNNSLIVPIGRFEVFIKMRLNFIIQFKEK